MKLGIKVGPNKTSVKDITATHPQMAEVWFDVNRANEYTELFDALKREGCDVGLHFWGATKEGLWANIAFRNKQLTDISMNFMRSTIDIAARNGFQYVNIHPGCAAKVAVDLINGSARAISEPIDFDLSTTLFLDNTLKLDKYAKAKNVILTIETVPARATDFWNDQERRKQSDHIVNLYELPVGAIVEAARNGISVTNDFGHTAASIIDNDPGRVWSHLLETTDRLLPQTKLIHLNFIIEPFNGTDIHDSLDNQVLDTDQAVPNKKQIITLLKKFNQRDDVWILSEPANDHVKNYFLAKKLLEEASQI